MYVQYSGTEIKRPNIFQDHVLEKNVRSLIPVPEYIGCFGEMPIDLTEVVSDSVLNSILATDTPSRGEFIPFHSRG